jgi:hypothetical protein
VRLHVSTGLRLLTIGSPLLLIVLGAYGVALGGTSSPGGVVLVVGLVLAVLAAWTLPWTTELDASGVRWRSVARERRIDWDDVVALERHRGRPDGPLVMRTVEHGKLALSDTVEHPAEWDELRELLAVHAPGAAMPDPPPNHPFHRR